MYPALPKFEITIYFVLWISLYGWSIFQVYLTSMKTSYIKRATFKNNLEYVEELNIPNPFKDTSDFEWSLWNYWVLEMIVYSYSLHFFVMRFSEVFCKKYRFHFSMMFSLGFCLYFFGIKGLMYIFAQTIFCFLVTFMTESVILTWIAALTSIYAFVSTSAVQYFSSQFSNDEYVVASYLCATATCSLRYTSYCLEYCWNAQKHIVESHPSKKASDSIRRPTFIHALHDLFLYQFYFPVFAGGPIFNYNEFSEQVKKEPVTWTLGFIFRYVLGICRYGLYQILIDCILHYFYFSSMHQEFSLIKNVPILMLCGLALCHVQFFCLKYMIIYGLPSKIALADNMVVPGGSHCVSAKHKFTFMWKYFDKGLHKWLVRYIFIPLGGSKHETGIIRSTFTSILVFAFVYAWHGMQTSHLYWAILNWFGVYIEKIANDVYSAKYVQDLEKRYLTPAMSRRIRALISTPVFSLLIISNLYFLAGVSLGNVYMKRIYTEDILSTILIHLVLYCGAQCSMEFSRRGI